jgi:hypothetical protein
MQSNKRRLKFVGIFLCVIGFCLATVNFLSPHLVIVTNEKILDSYANSVLELTQNLYFNPKPITAGQTFKVTWSSDTSLEAYIFTQEQFNNYSVNFLYQIKYQAKGSGTNGSLTFNVQNSDNYTAVLRNNPLMDGSSAQVYEFKMSSIVYSTENDNLYLYIGFVPILIGILLFLISRKLLSVV